MFRLLVILPTSIFVFLISFKALSCTCAAWANAQQVSHGDDIVVAKVRTLSTSPDGKTKLWVEKVYKGQAPTGQLIEVQGGDGGNCHGPILQTHDAWVAIMNKFEQGYATASCGDSSLAITDRKIQIEIGEKAGLTDQEFADLVNGKLVPTVKGMICSMYAERHYWPLELPNDYDFSWGNQIETSGSDNLAITDEHDFKENGVNVGYYNFTGTATRLTGSTYSMNTKITEPFFNQSYENTITTDVTVNSWIDGIYFFKATDLNGADVGQDVEPRLEHTGGGNCNLVLGLPIVPLRE